MVNGQIFVTWTRCLKKKSLKEGKRKNMTFATTYPLTLPGDRLGATRVVQVDGTQSVLDDVVDIHSSRFIPVRAGVVGGVPTVVAGGAGQVGVARAVPVAPAAAPTTTIIDLDDDNDDDDDDEQDNGPLYLLAFAMVIAVILALIMQNNDNDRI